MTSPSHTAANSFSNSSTWAARFSGFALLSRFFTFFHVSFARRRTRRMLLRPACRPNVWNTHCLSFFSVQPGPGRPCSEGELVSTTSAICCASGSSKRGRGRGAAVGQGVRAVRGVAMHPAADGLVLPTDVGGAGGGVEEPGGDRVQRLEALTAAPVRRRHRGAAQVFEALAPFGQIDADHRTTPGQPPVGTFAPRSDPNTPETKTPGLNLIAV